MEMNLSGMKFSPKARAGYQIVSTEIIQLMAASIVLSSFTVRYTSILEKNPWNVTTMIWKQLVRY